MEISKNVPSEKRKEQEETLEDKKKSTIRKQSETNLAKSMQASKTFYLPPTEKIKVKFSKKESIFHFQKHPRNTPD